ncbi:hypothetical protein K7432_014780, partial [Basidiobolus ranarum]
NYGFERVSDRRRTKQSGVTSWMIYSHQYFKRDQPDSLLLIQRISSPYSKVRNQVPTLAENKDIRPKLLTSPLSSISSSTPRVSLLSICNKDTVVEFSSCTALKCEVAALRKTIEYYKYLIEDSVYYIDILVKDQAACTNDMSQFLIPFFTVPISLEDGLLGLWANSNPNVYSYFCPYPSSMDDNE